MKRHTIYNEFDMGLLFPSPALPGSGSMGMYLSLKQCDCFKHPKSSSITIRG